MAETEVMGPGQGASRPYQVRSNAERLPTGTLKAKAIKLTCAAQKVIVLCSAKWYKPTELQKHFEELNAIALGVMEKLMEEAEIILKVVEDSPFDSRVLEGEIDKKYVLAGKIKGMAEELGVGIQGMLEHGGMEMGETQY